MIHLLVGGIRRAADQPGVVRLGEVLDVREDAPVRVLQRARRGDVGGDPGVEEDVVEARVGVNGDPAEDEEPAPGVELVR